MFTGSVKIALSVKLNMPPVCCVHGIINRSFKSAVNFNDCLCSGFTQEMFCANLCLNKVKWQEINAYGGLEKGTAINRV